ncbi:MAG: single-stranded-DNA-specific exonuclease RecJ [Bacteroidetes bacterium]|nr:MAG: single-stranded-DNA-specific exonuclease RecJ [Bacteroidota bacterium]TAG89012.1 MAG: single-stranded-DNA-specific exonuclease RecJ [Bacteroidota bacterium]
MKKRWIYKPLPDADLVKNLAEKLTIEISLAQLLVQRNILTFDEAKTFFRPSLDDLHDPFLMKNMENAVNRIEKAIRKKEKILVYGDYDVDGTTSVALVYGFLSKFHTHIDFYIPDRQIEGYGISKLGIDWAKTENVSLIIALDCGIKSNEMIDYAKTQGIDFVICDHHLPAGEIPNAIAVLDPKQADCQYPFKELSGCGVGFKLMQAFSIKNQIPIDFLFEFLDLVVVSIASDLVLMVGENRVLAYFGLEKLNRNPRIGLRALMNVSGFHRESMLEISNLVFTIGPRINAVGRLTQGKKAVELLVSHNKEEAENFALSINKTNYDRQDLDTISTQEAFKMVEERKKMKPDLKAIIIYKEDWHKGIVGIIASRCVDKYHLPTIVLTLQDGKITGSARSIPDFNIYEMLGRCVDLLTEFGGHQQASGLAMPIENLEKFTNMFETIAENSLTPAMLIPPQEIDLKLELYQITPKFYKILKQMAPFGPENMRPIFSTENLVPMKVQIMKEKHLKFTVVEPKTGISFVVVAFGLIDFYVDLSRAKTIDLCYSIEENIFQNKSTLQLRARDIRTYY